MSLRALTQGGGGAGGAYASIFVTGLDENSTVSATKDGKVIYAKWNSVETRFEITKIKEYGMWTVTATNGEETKTQDVLVDAAVEFEIEMDYKLWLYREGDECEDVTGGWSADGYTWNHNESVSAATKLLNSFYADASTSDEDVLGTKNAINFAKYKTLGLDRMSTDPTNRNQPWIGALIDKDVGGASRVILSTAVNAANVREIQRLDISDLNGSYYVAFAHTNSTNSGAGYAYNIWLE